MKYALLAYSAPAEGGERQPGKIDAGLAEVLARPNVRSCLRRSWRSTSSIGGTALAVMAAMVASGPPGR